MINIDKQVVVVVETTTTTETIVQRQEEKNEKDTKRNVDVSRRDPFSVSFLTSRKQ